MGTLFSVVYDRFLGKITDDMYIELTPADTKRDMQALLVDSIPGFEFPRQVITYQISTSEVPLTEVPEDAFVLSSDEDAGTAFIDNSAFGVDLTDEEINIYAILMMVAWIQRQVASIENTRMKYSGTDFKLTSQANHLQKLLTLLAEGQRQSHHMQRLYKRRKTDENGKILSNWSCLREVSALDD